ncbi:hypothetical protein ONS95_014565 [Cadophora gregata]|uniref:uncharacterized protein n=1 Tax=Cadophora gregata TaxID=51156 RepID=UPI0026DC0641|nr:uncharacterized protein ONS95_014565 [Cadophora gregata]KAK0112840.1 hypothetical protein ONS95_014565 [Cadophora gregata]KAK0124912.1 hypothetical protein ONS96_008789 [Cadophora gregata f. sp. sojae]
MAPKQFSFGKRREKHEINHTHIPDLNTLHSLATVTCVDSKTWLIKTSETKTNPLEKPNSISEKHKHTWKYRKNSTVLEGLVCPLWSFQGLLDAPTTLIK